MKTWLLAMVVAVTSMGLLAQEDGERPERGGRRPRNFDPAQMQQRMLDAVKERLAIGDEDWQVIGPRLETVMAKERAVRELQARRRGRWGGAETEAPAEVTAVEKAIEADDAEAIKTALAALREARAGREAEAGKARDALREVLTVKQEAQLVLMGTLE